MNWQVLHLRPRCEKKLAEFCKLQNLDHYLPLRRETKIYQRRKVTVDKPVFPGYIFVCFDSEERLSLLKTNNIVRVLAPPPQEQLVFELNQIRGALSVDPSLGACNALTRGRRVRITGGPFMGIEGMVDKVKNATTVRLNVDMIGQAVSMEIAREFLSAID